MRTSTKLEKGRNFVAGRRPPPAMGTGQRGSRALTAVAAGALWSACSVWLVWSLARSRTSPFGAPLPPVLHAVLPRPARRERLIVVGDVHGAQPRARGTRGGVRDRKGGQSAMPIAGLGAMSHALAAGAPPRACGATAAAFPPSRAERRAPSSRHARAHARARLPRRAPRATRRGQLLGERRPAPPPRRPCRQGPARARARHIRSLAQVCRRARQP